MVSYIKKKSHKLKTQYRTYYISKGSLEEIKAGVLPVGVPLKYISSFIDALPNTGK